MAAHCLSRFCAKPLYTHPCQMTGATVIPMFRDGEMEAWRGCYILEDTQYVNSRVGICAFNDYSILPS